jgi:hypothetical protein
MSIQNSIRNTVAAGIDRVANAPVGAILGGAFTLAVGALMVGATLPAPRVELYNTANAAACLTEQSALPEGMTVEVHYLYAERDHGKYEPEKMGVAVLDSEYNVAARFYYAGGDGQTTEIQTGDELVPYIGADLVSTETPLTEGALNQFASGMQACAQRAVYSFDPSMHVHKRLGPAITPVA